MNPHKEIAPWHNGMDTYVKPTVWLQSGALMPMTLDLALRKARAESFCWQAVWLIDRLPEVLRDSGVDAYAGALEVIRKLLIPWDTYDGNVVRRCISRRVKALTSLSVERVGDSQEYRKLLQEILA